MNEGGDGVMNSLRAEYEQTWQDFRHRTTVQTTILSVYFATVTGLIYTFAQHGTETGKEWIGLLVGLIGVFLSIGVLALLLGERRPWSADLTRLERLEEMLSNKSEPTERQLERVSNYHCLWLEEKYSFGLAGSFTWYLLIVGITGTLFGAIVGFGLTGLHWLIPLDHYYTRLVMVILCLSMTLISLIAVFYTIKTRTIEKSEEKCDERKKALKRVEDGDG
ncbi:MAG: hypothetical protein LN417_04525 [Candidatus Thermoplasmatota archaeon]|nr:hypothetical protein [Candidatus Thermoplasmatota archaeon]